MEKGYLVLQDGQVFEGLRFGAGGDTVGELVFTTGMCGYIETLTDPSYAGQIVLQTYPLIGNYGIIREDFEGACCVKGYVVREYCDAPSNFRCDCDLDAYLKEQNVPGLCGVDTRELTRIIREHGVMNAAICSGIPAVSYTHLEYPTGKCAGHASEQASLRRRRGTLRPFGEAGGQDRHQCGGGISGKRGLSALPAPVPLRGGQ